MKCGLRAPSITRMVSARLSPKRYMRQSLGLKAPRGLGWVTNPKRALYNRIYHRTTFNIFNLVRLLFRGKR